MTEPAGTAESKTVFILGVSSDIGRGLADRFLGDGCRVVGTYRDYAGVASLANKTHLLPCDLADRDGVRTLLNAYARLSVPWDVFISAVGSEEPIGPFFQCDFDAWEQSVIVNATAQLRVLHGLYPHRRPDQAAQVIFFAGGGTNNPFTNYSAYCLAKIMLIKMCELLDDENPDLNAFILGPGFVRTKIHEQTLKQPSAAGKNYEKTLNFLRAKDPGTSLDDIYRCMHWCIRQGRGTAGGRNFSVVHDPWREPAGPLAEWLRADPDKFKLRRHRNAG